MLLYQFVSIAGPWVPFALFASGLLLCVRLYGLLKKDNRALRSQLEEKEAAWKENAESIHAEIEALKNGLMEAEQRAGLLVAPKAPRSGFNISKRSLALRMSRLGEKSENIATALSLPRREVDLLLKVQKIVIASSEHRA